MWYARPVESKAVDAVAVYLPLSDSIEFGLDPRPSDKSSQVSLIGSCSPLHRFPPNTAPSLHSNLQTLTVNGNTIAFLTVSLNVQCYSLFGQSVQGVYISIMIRSGSLLTP